MSKIAFANVELIVAYADLEQEGRVGMGVLGKQASKTAPDPPPPTFRQTIILKTGLPLSLDKFSETSHVIEFSYDDTRAFMMML